jgi:hypothetical protein
VFVAIPLFMIWAFAIVDLFGRHDLGGFAKVLWLLFIIFLPLIGTICYYLFRPTVLVAPSDMGAARAGYVADTLTQLKALRDSGDISQAEYEKQRSQLLAST